MFREVTEMKSMLKVLVMALATVVVVTAVAPVAEAQCSPRVFASIGGGGTTPKMQINPAGASASLATAQGRIWQCADSTLSNNFDVASGAAKTMKAGNCGQSGPGDICCATRDLAQTGGGWWQVTATTLRGVNGFMGGAGCGFNGACVQGDMCIALEDYDSAGPPGVGGTAYLIGWRQIETPGGSRYWDLANFCGPAGSGTTCQVPFVEFPVPKVLSSSKDGGGNRDLTMDSSIDPDASVYIGVNGQGPANTLIASYDLMVHYGPGDPGRDRNATCGGPACWALAATIPYSNSATLGAAVDIACPNPSVDAWIAFGLTYHGGGGAKDVPSTRVGRAIQIECDPNIADPPKPRPTIRIDERPTSGGKTPERSRGGR
jgi:hypothetical protein